MHRYRKLAPRRKLIIFPLMDMFFILLIFYLMVQGGQKPILHEVGVPQRINTGEAHTIIQIIDEDQFLWLDSASIDEFADKSMSSFIAASTIDKERLDEHIDTMKARMSDISIQHYLVMIRCPDRTNYGTVNEIITHLIGDGDDGAQHRERLLMSISGGSYEDIRWPQRIGEDREGRMYLELTFGDG